MTACVDTQEKKGGAAKAVSATLAGVLAVGMVPAAAFAAETPVDEGEGIETLAVDPETAFEQGTIVAIDNNGETVVDGATVKEIADEPIKFAYDENAHYVVPQTVTPVEPSGASAEDVTNEKSYEVVYEDSEGTEIEDPATITEPGTYTVTITAIGATNPYKDAEISFEFTITPASLKDAVICGTNDEGKADASLTTFVYDGTTHGFSSDLNLAVDGAIIPKTMYKSVKTYPYGDEAKTGTTIKDAGTYVVEIQGESGTVYEGETVRLEIEIEQLNLGTADLTVGTDNVVVTSGTYKPTAAEIAINGKAGNLDSDVEVAYVSDDQGFKGFGAKGTYEISIAPVKDNKNVTGTGSITYVAVANAATITYDTVTFDGHSLSVNNATPSTAFDKSLIKVMAGADELKEADGDYAISVETADGQAATLDSLKTPGSYKVTVEVNAAAQKYNYGGVATMDVKVIDGTLAENQDVYFTYNGQVVTSVKVKYDGTDLLDRIGYVVKNEDGEVLTAGTDYKVEITKSVNGADVAADEMIDAGSYKIVLKSAGYAFSGSEADRTLNVTIDDIDVTSIRVAESELFLDRANSVAYTGEAIVPTFEYDTGETDEAGETIWAELPADAYTISKIEYTAEGAAKAETVESILDAGTYKLTIADNAKDGNYNVKVTGGTITVTVVEGTRFQDVPSDAWYVDYVVAVNNEQTSDGEPWMGGYQGTNVFGPNNAIIRGDAVTVLYRMADGPESSATPGDVFDDVEAGIYYAKPILWASQTGIANGYEGTGEFRPEQTITREEFATMLYRYASVTNQLGDAEAADLSQFSDGASVNEWAQEAMEWAIGAGIMGGYGDTGVLGPQNQVTRAEVAKMVYQLQLA